MDMDGGSKDDDLEMLRGLLQKALAPTRERLDQNVRGWCIPPDLQASLRSATRRNEPLEPLAALSGLLGDEDGLPPGWSRWPNHEKAMLLAELLLKRTEGDTRPEDETPETTTPGTPVEDEGDHR
jgi:hypothetical protein